MRIIARLDVKNNFVIKGINLEGLRKIGEVKNITEKYYKEKIDEILIMDSVASLYGRNNLFDFIKGISKEIFVPITLGGGIRTLFDIEKALNSGADKVSINSQALLEPKFLQEATQNFGESTIVVSIEAKKIAPKTWEPYKFCGRERTNINLNEWLNTIQDFGCGEILLTSIDKEGTETGFDLSLLNSIYNKITKPLIISGGCGKLEDIKYIHENYKDTSVALASVLHYDILNIKKIKDLIN